jgi:WD40 repeat protein
MAGKRLVLSIAVSRFDGDLEFAPDLRRSLLAVLRSAPFDYEEVAVPGGGSLPAVPLGRCVLDTIDKCDADDVLIVHVISHGYADEGKTAAVHVIGSDGKHDVETDVAFWLGKVRMRGTAAPQTLFVLDFCYSGNAPAVEAMLRDPDLSPRAWLICASQPADLAYDGRLTRAVTDVLGHVGESGLTRGSMQEFIPLDMVSGLIRTAVEELSADTGADQQITASFFDISAPPAAGRFFPNRYYDQTEAELQREKDELRRHVDTGVAPFIDSLFDAAHFISRARGRGPREAFDASGCFYGRRSQLVRLRDWAVQGEGAPFQVVTGNPGAGKSALLGMLVCGVHPRLSLHTEHLRARYLDVLDTAVNAMVAVHARQHRTSEIKASVARQLGLQPGDGQWTGQALVAGLRELAKPPVIVIDALDEAVDLGELVDVLLTLADAVDNDGRPACRLLVGTRARAEIEPLLDAVRRGGDMPIDLDNTDATELRHDLTDYVDALLASAVLYRSAEGAVVRRELASRMAEALTSQPKGVGEWGEFLVALLQAKQLVGLAELPDPANVQVPVNLPDVFEQDISSSYHTKWLRPVLTAIAYALGDGMPPEVVCIVARGFHPDGDSPTHHDVAVALRDARFYLRQGIDDDGATLYRLFHQGLADHLRSGHRDLSGGQQLDPDSPKDGNAAIVDLVLAYVESRPGGWEHLTPYLLRDIVDHARLGKRLDALATSPDFLVNARSRWLRPVLTYQSPYARTCAGVYMASFARHQLLEPTRRRHVLAIDAARQGVRELADDLADPLPWRPRWATGEDLNAAPRILADDLSAPAVACARLSDETPVAVTTGKDVRVWDLGVGGLHRPPLTRHTGWIHAVACTTLHDGTPIAVTAGNEVLVWNLDTGALHRPPLTGHTGWIHAVACTTLHDGMPIAVTAGNEVLVWNLDTGTQRWPPLGAPDGWVGAVACTTLADGTPIAITSGANRVVRTWNLDTRQPLGKPLTGHDGWVGAVACTTLADGTLIGMTGGDDGTVRIWDLASGEPHGKPLTGHKGWVRTVVCSVLPDGTRIAMTAGNDFTVLIWNLDRAELHQGPLAGHVSWINAMTCATVGDGLPIAVTCSDDRTVRVWEVPTQTQMQPSGSECPGPIKRIFFADLADGTHLAIAADDQTPWAWNAATGEPHTLNGFDVPDPGDRQVVTLRTGPEVMVRGGDAVHVDDSTTGNPYVQPLTGHLGVVQVACAVLPDGTPVAVSAGNHDRVASISNLETGESFGEPLKGHTDDICAVACGTGGDGMPIVVTGGDTGALLVWDLTTRETVYSIDLPARADVLAVDRDGTVLAAMGRDLVALEFRLEEGPQ